MKNFHKISSFPFCFLRLSFVVFLHSVASKYFQEGFVISESLNSDGTGRTLFLRNC